MKGGKSVERRYYSLVNKADRKINDLKDRYKKCLETTNAKLYDLSYVVHSDKSEVRKSYPNLTKDDLEDYFWQFCQDAWDEFHLFLNEEDLRTAHIGSTSTFHISDNGGL